MGTVAIEEPWRRSADLKSADPRNSIAAFPHDRRGCGLSAIAPVTGPDFAGLGACEGVVMAVELAHRHHDGVAVTLTWDKLADRIRVNYIDERSGDTFAAIIPKSKALDAFHHPNLYRPELRQPTSAVSPSSAHRLVCGWQSIADGQA
jgi:hypothetical protein